MTIVLTGALLHTLLKFQPDLMDATRNGRKSDVEFSCQPLVMLDLALAFVQVIVED